MGDSRQTDTNSHPDFPHGKHTRESLMPATALGFRAYGSILGATDSGACQKMHSRWALTCEGRLTCW